MAAIVVPFRGAGGKQRLGPLTDDEREALALAMLEDVLAACCAAGDTLVVTSDDDGARVADAHGARFVGPALVVNADVPCVTPDDLDRLAVATPAGGFALVPARDGTTNALGLSEPSLFAPLYGPGSAERFRLHGERLGVDVVTAEIANLVDDVDSIDDLRRLERRVGPRTRLAEAR
jgi:2-phospho-L-lactate guanylyltransferase (CobY/MobA/RfbA family)